jgi:hypothetical protein
MSDVETPEALLRRIYDEEFGFLPTNASLKPVHVANGVARRVFGVTTDHTPLARVLRQYVENQGGRFLEERNPNSTILSEYGPRFLDRDGNPPSDEALARFRALAKDTLGADGAVFPPKASTSGQLSASPASFTLSHKRMITNDVSDNGSGDLIAALLRAGSPPRPAKAADLMTELLQEDTDPWTMIAWPLLDLGEEREATLGAVAQARAERVAALLATNEQGTLESPILRELRERFDQLAAYEEAAGAKLTALRRLVLFACFSVHVHMIRRCGDVLDNGPRPPLLLDLFDGRLRSLREASAATLQAGFRSIEQLVLHRIRTHLDAVSEGDPEGYLASLPGGAETDAVSAEYEAQRAGLEPLDALSEAYWKTGYSGVGPGEVKGFPWNALLALGRRSGYLLPYDDRGRGGREHKRYGVNAEFAEVLVAATVARGDPMDFDDFLDTLRLSYGVVLGRATDFDVIRRNDLRPEAALTRSVSVNEGDLRANLTAFRDLIVDIGFAKSYADGRTVVTVDEGRR